MDYWNQFVNLINYPILKVGTSQITIWTIVYIVLLLILLFTVTNRLKRWVVDKLFAKSSVDYGVRQAMGSIATYAVIAIGTLIILDTAGINLSALTIVAGALGIGIGFGLQNITTNFISGIILLLERPIKVGDRIEMEKISGDVVKISLRATTVVTNDNISVIVPNSEFISSKVINWSQPNREVRCNFPIGVSYGSDIEQVRKLLLEAAANHPGILQDPPPDVLLEAFGDSAIEFNLRVWTRIYTTKPGVLRSDLYYVIANKFEEFGIEIPYPQREVYVRGGNLNVQMKNEAVEAELLPQSRKA